MKLRNAKGAGNVRQRADGSWEARCTINGVRRSFYGQKQSDVLKEMRAAQKSADDGSYFNPTTLTVGQWLNTWLQEYVTNAKVNTYRTYADAIKLHLLPALGKIKLRDLDTTRIQKLYNELSRVQGFKPETIRHIHSVLRTALNKAVKLRYLCTNPCTACTPPQKQKAEIKPLSEVDIKTFLAEIQKDERYTKLLTVALFTGMRKGELCGLPWDAVDFRKGTITIKQQLIKDPVNGGHRITTPKGKDRTIKPAAFVMDVLRQARQEQIRDRMAAGLAWRNEWNLVFTDKLGHFILPATAYQCFKRIANAIGRPDARFHDLRHTYAVTALQEGDDPKTVQQNLGHATATFTLDVYGHVSDTMRERSAARMQAYYDKITS